MPNSNMWPPDYGLNGHAQDLSMMLGRVAAQSDILIDHMREHREDMGEVKERLAAGQQLFHQHHSRITALETRKPAAQTGRELPAGLEKVVLRLGTITIALLTGALTGTLGKILEILQASLKIAETLK